MTREELARFAIDVDRERGIVERVIEVRETEVLPHQQPEPIARRVERVGLVGHRAADADHVETGVAGEPEQVAIGRVVRVQRERRGAAPACAAREHGHAVDAQSEPLAVGAGIDLDRAKTRRAERPARSADMQRDLVERRFAMRMRPPAAHVGDRDARAQPVGAGPFERRVMFAARQPRRERVGQRRGERQFRIEPARVAFDACLQFVIGENVPVGRIEHVDGPPRAGGHVRRKPARHVPEQRRADRAQPGRLGQPRAPARPARCACVAQVRRECAETERQPVRAVERHGHVVRDEHAVREEDRRVVEPGLRERREAVKAQDARPAPAQLEAVPVVALVERRGFVEPAGQRERLRDRAGHRRRDPAAVVGREVARVLHGTRGRRQHRPRGQGARARHRMADTGSVS